MPQQPSDSRRSRRSPAPEPPSDSPADSGSHKRGQLYLDPGLPLATGLVESLAAILGYAGAQRQRVEQDPIKAIHEYRKSIRRGRAVLRLIRGEGWRALDHVLRDAVRATSVLRDRDVLLDLLQGVPEGFDPAPWRALVESERERHDPAAVLEAGATAVAPVPRLWGAEILGPELSMRRLRRKLARSFARAQEARQRAQRTRADVDVHRWRKRVKELRYQLELLGARRAGPSRALHAALVDQATGLGEITDDVVLHDYVEAQGERAGLAWEPLQAAIRARIELRVRDALAGTGVFYDTRPRVFARQALANFLNARA